MPLSFQSGHAAHGPKGRRLPLLPSGLVLGALAVSVGSRLTVGLGISPSRPQASSLCLGVADCHRRSGFSPCPKETGFSIVERRLLDSLFYGDLRFLVEHDGLILTAVEGIAGGVLTLGELFISVAISAASQ